MSTPTNRKQLWLSRNDISLLWYALQAMNGYCTASGAEGDTPPKRLTRKLVERMVARLEALNEEKPK